MIIAQRARKSTNSAVADYYPRSFFDHLRSACKVFASLPKEYLHPLAANLWTGTSTRMSHSVHSDAFTMHWRSRQKMYGTAKSFHEMNRSIGWFELLEGAKPNDNIAQAWRLTNTARSLVAGYFSRAHVERSGQAGGLVTAEGKIYRMPTDAIRSRTTDGGNTLHPRKAMQCAVEVSGDALHRFHKAAEAWLLGDPCPTGFEWAYQAWDAIKSDRGPNGGEQRAINRVNDAIVQASAILHIAKASSVPGYVLPITYLEYPTGRLFAEGAHNLQTCQREVRRAALDGAWDVDVSNCHWALIQQMAARIGLQTPSINHYLDNKRRVRTEVAMAGGISHADAKQVLIGLIYGMNLEATEESRRKAIIDSVGEEAAARLRIFQPLLELFHEVKSLRGAIIADYQERSTRKGHIVNDIGRVIPNKAPPAEKLAHILQGAEASILSAVIQHHGPGLKLLAHDGWVMATRPDQGQLEGMLYEQTGYRVELEISQL